MELCRHLGFKGRLALKRILAEKKSPCYDEVAKGYEDYFSALKGIFERYAEEQKDSEFLFLPRTPEGKKEAEDELNRGDPFYYMFPNLVLSSGVAGFGTKEAEKIIHTYSHGGQSENGLVFPVYRSVSGVGRTWYTSWAEHDRFLYYEASGNREKQLEIIEALLKYNLTKEFYQCERYDDHNAYIAPWMPNASANGRLLYMLFSYFGKKDCKKNI